MKKHTYIESEALLERALKVIPLGTQTFSKSFEQFPRHYSPLFIKKGKGCKVWDQDDNEYIDLISGLLPVILGYCDPDVNNAIKQQLELGISFSLASELEVIVAEKLVKNIPCAESVRFGKNGSDATSACIRLARAITGKDHVICCGYHGWHDWYIGSTVRNKGVPTSINELTHKVPYNDIESIFQLFKKYPDNIAAVILEPANSIPPKEGFLHNLKDFVKSKNALFIFDEVITGFRFSKGGAQEYFDVTPDLSAFGKAMGNGMPISAVVGKEEYMEEMEEVFFSATFGGETLSLAAANAVIDKIEKEPVIEKIWERGGALKTGVKKLLASNQLEEIIEINGYEPWTMLMFKDHSNGTLKEAIKTFFMKHMINNGVLIAASHNLNYAHNDEDINNILNVYEKVLSNMAVALDDNTLVKNLDCPLIQPVFSVR
ncbi:MAG: glutamate-1-semialdehyde 2,1-aminomutase [Thermodesulfobacteriota bacterium]|nr:MAG: glutamate-1-semialdehyde 2,1-aminomutase [Thermodesulfobacteriota bacterium]